MPTRRRAPGALRLAPLLLLCACRHDDVSAERSGSTASALTTSSAVAVLAPTQGHDVHGMVTFVEENGGVRVLASLWGLSEGEHGFHVHEHGDCGAPDASSAGDHFSPDDDPHGPPEARSGQRHAGDFGNVRADARGHAVYERLDTQIALTGPDGIVGRAVIVHAGRDDLRSQPSGDAGARVACGVVMRTMP